MAVIMAWSKCSIKIGETPVSEAMAENLTSIGTIKNQTAVLESEEGDALEAVATGGEVVAKESLEGGFSITARIIEPTDALYTQLGLGEAVSGTAGAYNVSTHLVGKSFSVEVTPKNAGARGIRAPKTNVTFAPGWSEEEGNYADITFELVHGEAGYWYQRFTTSTAL